MIILIFTNRRRHSSHTGDIVVFLAVIIACICTSNVQSAGADETYSVRVIAGKGNGDLEVNVPALEATFYIISGITQSTNGDLYATAKLKHVVLKFTFNKEEGTWSNVTIIAGTGSKGTGAEGILGTESALDTPCGLSLIEDDSTGEVTTILIADTNNNRIRKLDMSTHIITTIAGTGLYGDTGDDGPAKDARLKYPRHVYHDKPNGDIFIADTDSSRIRRVRDGIIVTVAGKACSSSDGWGDGGQAVDACLKNPYQFTVNDKGEWLIADYGNNRIRKVDSNGTITTVAGGGNEIGDAPATDVKLGSPSSISLTPSGEMLVTDYGKNVVRKVDDSGFMRVIAGGSETPSSTNPLSSHAIPAKNAFIRPLAVTYARDGSDAIFIGDYRGYIFKLTSTAKCYDVKSDNEAVCSGHGSCTAPDECKCDNGWMGIDCSITHCFGVTSNLLNVCSGKGKCVRRNKCHCEEGFCGHKCHRPIY